MPNTREGEASWLGLTAVLVGASLFATSGTIIKHLTQDYGIPPLTVATVRITMAASVLLIGLAIFDRKLLRIRRSDVPFFLLYGFLAVTLTQACWVFGISLIDVGVATALNYTAPAFTAVLAWPLLGEVIDRRKVLALLLTAAGVALIVRIFDARFVSLNGAGLLWALGSGLGYALYNVFGRHAMKRYASWTTVTYTFTAGALFLLLTQSAADLRVAFVQPEALLWLCVLVLVPTLGGYLLYTLSLRFLKASVAAILATVEPVIAALIAAGFLGERLSAPQIAGGVLIIAGVVALQVSRSPGRGLNPRRATAE